MTEPAATLRSRATRLAWFTVAWDAVEGVIAVTAGILAGSIALVGFGIDSSIEVFAAGVVVWQLKKPEDEARQRLALRLIGTTFFALAAYVSYEAVKDLVTQDKPDASILGIVLNVVALAVMIPLARMKRDVGGASGQPHCDRRFGGDTDLELPFGKRPGWTQPQCAVRMVVG